MHGRCAGVVPLLTTMNRTHSVGETYANEARVHFGYSCPYTGGRIINRASFVPHLAHLRRPASTESLDAPPPIFAASTPSSVLAAPHPLHSILKPAPKRTRSPIVRMCFVDIRCS